MKKKIVFLLFFVFFSLGCSESTPEKEVKSKPIANKTQAASFKTIEWSDAVKLNQEGNAIFLDVRTLEEVAEGTIQGALVIPVQELDRRYAEIPKDKKLLIFCRSGRRSAMAASMLIQAGYSEVYNIQGGYSIAPAGL